MVWEQLLSGIKNAVFLGEAGCGKSELAIDLALSLAAQGETVHFFDMDQTKPLFRSRDVAALLEQAGVVCHYEQQTADAPTMVGGVAPLLLNESVRVILDVGGGDAGARLIGGFAPLLKRPNTSVFYIVNPYRPWSGSIEAIDSTLTAVLHAAHLQKPRYIANPNLGADTTAAEFSEGLETTLALLSPYVTVEAAAMPAWLVGQVSAPLPLLPITPRINYPWDESPLK